MIKKAIITVITGLILIAAFSLLVYPTQYKYFKIDNHNLRTNVITGKTFVFVPDRQEWVNVKEL